MASPDSLALQKGCREFDIPFDHQQMADYLNPERTALSKELSRMKKDGLILYTKNHDSFVGETDSIYGLASEEKAKRVTYSQ